MQHGYKTQHSPVTELHTVNNTVAKGFNQMAPPARTITVALDMSKAFDTINIHTLFRTIIKLIVNYIKGRKAVDLKVIHCHLNPETGQKDSSLGTSCRPISLLWPAAKVIEALLLPTVNNHLLPPAYQHGFRPGHSTTSALLQLKSDIATGFNQRKPPHRTVCVAVDLTEAFDTVKHNVLLSNIVISTLPEATCRWLSNYIRGRQSVTSSRGVKSKARIIHTGVPQGLKLSPTLFSFYIADMPRPTEPVKRICYADDITVWASGVEISELEHKVNTYLTEMSRFLRENSILISAPKSSVTLFTPDPAQANTHPKIKIADSEILASPQP